MEYPKRLIEVDLPIKKISEATRQEKNIRHGHISALHIWWARRPLAACRAVICASLWPDPADQNCSDSFRQTATMLLSELRDKRGGKPIKPDNVLELRNALLNFIVEFSNWDNAATSDYIDTCRAITKAANNIFEESSEINPLIVDPFAGGGAIPFEALRIGTDVFASDLNPIAVLLNKIILEYLPVHGTVLAKEVREWGTWVYAKSKEELSSLYPKHNDDSIPLAYIWARTIISEAPDKDKIPIEVPLIKSMWLAQKGKNSVGMKWKRNHNGKIETEIVNVKYANGKQIKVRRPLLEIVNFAKKSDLDEGTVKRGSVTCPVSGYTTPVTSVREQLKKRNGGSFDARLCVVVLSHPRNGKKFYQIPSQIDINAMEKASKLYSQMMLKDNRCFPDEQMPASASGYCAPPTYGAKSFSDLFNKRQLIFARWLIDSFDRWSEERNLSKKIRDAVQASIALVINRLIDSNSSQCWWVTIHGETVMRTFGRQAYPIIWDFSEINPLADSSRGIEESTDIIAKTLEYNAYLQPTSVATTLQAPAQKIPLPHDACSALITDPPYYNAIPYSDLADFYYVWLSRYFKSNNNWFHKLFSETLSPKNEEIVEMSSWDSQRYSHKTNKWYENEMSKALEQGRLIVKPHGIMVLVFAHKKTSAWEALISAVISAGWIITASWPIDTENARRLRAQRSATLESSIHLVCRPRENHDGTLITNYVGDWRDVLSELPKRIHEWMPRLSAEGVVGADAIFACLGPGLEIFSRYSSVEKASGEEVTLKEYLEQVWAVVAKEALNMIFEGADTSGFEEDARLTAMWLWTLSTGTTNGDEAPSDDEEDEDDEEKSPKAKLSGYELEYDAARKIAQGLGANLEHLQNLVEVKGDKARLLPVSERTKALFGKEEAESPSANRKKKSPQLELGFMEEVVKLEQEGSWGQKNVPHLGNTRLDRLHQSMILFAASRGEALKRFLVEEGVGRDQKFWKLAQALSALYPSISDEKRWVDGVLARKKGLGF